MKQILIFLFIIFLGGNCWAQNLDKMNEAERTNALVQIAKKTILEIGPDFYREYGKPEIKHSYVSKDNKESTKEEDEKYNGRSFYTVKFLYDKTKESFIQDYSAKVYIWGDTGQPYTILFGSGLGQQIPGQADTRSTKAAKWTWKKQPVGKFNTTRRIKQEYNPQKEYVRGQYKKSEKIE